MTKHALIAGVSGIIGRLFREFAVTVTVTIAVSAFVALTLTPMMASRFLRSEKDVQHNKLYQWSERMFDALVNRYSVESVACDLMLGFFFPGADMIQADVAEAGAP